MLEKLDVMEWMKLNAKLQTKKNNLRKVLKEKGILKKGATNEFDHYNYFSEAQYKELFTGLFADCLLELKFNEIDYQTFEGTEKQGNGRMAKLCFRLVDVETGFYEETIITGEGIDKGDKAGYKAYTGALKYYLADTFCVATGDDPERESPDAHMNTVTVKKATPKQIEVLLGAYKDDNLAKLLAANNISRIEDLPMSKASELIGKLRERGKQNG